MILATCDLVHRVLVGNLDEWSAHHSITDCYIFDKKVPCKLRCDISNHAWDLYTRIRQCCVWEIWMWNLWVDIWLSSLFELTFLNCLNSFFFTSIHWWHSYLCFFCNKRRISSKNQKLCIIVPGWPKVNWRDENGPNSKKYLAQEF